MNIQLIKKCFPDFEADLYGEMLQHGTEKQIKKGEIILRSGQLIRSTILVVEGLIKLYREDKEGNEYFIYYLRAGQACALSMTFVTSKRTSEVLAEAYIDSVLLNIPLECMDKWMSKFKSWNQFVINSYREHFEELLQTIDAISFSTMDERLEFYLTRQVKQFGPKIKLTHLEIARDLNSSREVISKLLKKMEARHYLKLFRNTIEWLK